jgi:hypothetical protein
MDVTRLQTIQLVITVLLLVFLFALFVFVTAMILGKLVVPVDLDHPAAQAITLV